MSRSRFTGRMYVPGARGPVTSLWPLWAYAALLVSGAWYGQRAVELRLSVRAHVFFSCEGRMKDVKTSVRGNVVLPMGAASCLMWKAFRGSGNGGGRLRAGGTLCDLPAVSCPFHLGYRRGCCDGSSSIKLLWRQQRSGGRGHRIIVQPADFPSCASGTWQRPWLLFGEARTRLVAVLKLRLFFCVGNVGFVYYIFVVAYDECELYFSLKCTYFRFYTEVSCLFGTAHAVHYCNYSPAINTVTSRKVRSRQIR